MSGVRLPADLLKRIDELEASGLQLIKDRVAANVRADNCLALARERVNEFVAERDAARADLAMAQEAHVVDIDRADKAEAEASRLKGALEGAEVLARVCAGPVLVDGYCRACDEVCSVEEQKCYHRLWRDWLTARAAGSQREHTATRLRAWVGNVSPPLRAGQVLALAEAMGCTMAWLIGNDDAPVDPPSAATPSRPKESGGCASWCGSGGWRGDHLVVGAVFVDVEGMCAYCTEACRDAGRSLHPAPGTAR